MARAALKPAARGAGRQPVPGYATLGAAIIADVALNTVATERMGDFAHLPIHPWGTSAFQAGSGFLLEPEIGRCTAGTMGRIATADGHVSDDEVRFIATHIDRQIYDENTWIDLPQNEKERWVTHLEAGNEVDCFGPGLTHRLIETANESSTHGSSASAQWMVNSPWMKHLS